jgi:hypothetical protein
MRSVLGGILAAALLAIAAWALLDLVPRGGAGPAPAAERARR